MVGNNRRKLVAGNWKMNLTPSEAVQYLQDFTDKLPIIRGYDVALFPAFITVPFVIANLLKRRDIWVGAQNLANKASGAFTGEVSAAMLKDAGCTFVLIGHSERRKIYGETEPVLAEKLALALAQGLQVCYCIGETLEERNADRTWSVLDEQLANLAKLDPKQQQSITLAYEPVWAIGTGVTASPAQAQEAHAYIRNAMTAKWGADAASALRILYGGSVTPDNAKELFGCEDVDGGLVGGASLKPASFLSLCQSAE